MQILVTGSTGNVGRYVMEAVEARGHSATAAVRKPDSAGSTKQVCLDLQDPTTWDAALVGIDAIFLMRPPAISEVETTLNAFVDRALGQLQQVVFLSVAGAEKNTFIPHAKVEAHLRASGVSYTFLRAGFFAQNLCGPYQQDIATDDRLYVPAGHEPVSWVDTRDLAEAAARAFGDPQAHNAAWTLTGAEARTFHEVADLLTKHLGRPITYQPAWLPAYLRHLTRNRGLPWSAALVYAVLHTAIRFGAEARTDPKLAELLGRAPRTIEDTIMDHLHLW